MTRNFVLAAALAVTASFASAQTLPPSSADIRTSEQIRKQAADMLVQARSNPGGVASVTLEKYPNHYTMLTVRTKSGGVEMHKSAADFFIVIEGEATILTGGTIADPKEAQPGETRGTKLTGAQSRTVHPGDVVHIAPGVPHQTLVAPGKIFTYYVIKVIQPEAK
ncbi:MAG: hypothetical protein JSS87_12280 [Acidobacteria bacterium]|nr:hypothetical protein [Acidobacteriota bacterium]